VEVHVLREKYAEWDDEERGGAGFDFTFAPAKPDNPEYRQLLAEMQRRWLECWQPYEGDWVQ